MIFHYLEILFSEVVNMVKGVSKQVIVVQSPDPALFEQAIFILKEGRPEVTDEMLLAQASHLMRQERGKKDTRSFLHKSIFMLFGAGVTGLIWLFSVIL